MVITGRNILARKKKLLQVTKEIEFIETGLHGTFFSRNDKLEGMIFGFYGSETYGYLRWESSATKHT